MIYFCGQVIRCRGHLTKFISFGSYLYSLTILHEREYLETLLTSDILDQRFIPGQILLQDHEATDQMSGTKQGRDLVLVNSNILFGKFMAALCIVNSMCMGTILDSY